MIDIRFSEPYFERQVIRDRFDLLVGVVATFEILARGRLLYRETEFTIVELRSQLHPWLNSGLTSRSNFEFASMEHDEAGLVWVRWMATEQGWRIGSIHQEYAEVAVWSDEEITVAVCQFIEAVDNWVAVSLNVRVRDILK